jgi:hypothetical protein
MTETIYIPLEDEGTSVRRPAHAYRRHDGKYIVLRPADYDPTLETWAFPPGTIVECERINLSGREILAAVRAAADSESTPGKQAV